LKKSKVAPKADSGDVGFNNANLDASVARLQKGHSYRNLSTIWIIPTRGLLKTKVVSSLIGLQRPMNQAVYGPLFIENEEVGVAYEKAFEMVLSHPVFKNYKFILTSEEDNLPPSDGLLKLYESIAGYDCVSGLYWTKSSSTSQVYSQPMIYGNPEEMPMNFVPQPPKVGQIQPCNGVGMGFALWRIDSLKTKLKNLERPWFRTLQEKDKAFTQDLYLCFRAAPYGFKFAVDNRCLVGHLDVSTGMVW
jgi:hypothetical protein